MSFLSSIYKYQFIHHTFLTDFTTHCWFQPRQMLSRLFCSTVSNRKGCIIERICTFRISIRTTYPTFYRISYELDKQILNYILVSYKYADKRGLKYTLYRCPNKLTLLTTRQVIEVLTYRVFKLIWTSVYSPIK